jgi:aspartate/methionine/tyrosine aminotransferase
MAGSGESRRGAVRTSTRGEVDPFIVMDVMEAARAEEARGRHVIHMEVGQPGTPAPAAAREALALAMAAGPLGYTVALGLPELRARIARLYRDWHGVELDPGRVVVTAGSSAGFILAFTSLFERGEKVAIGEPGYPSYRNILKALDLTPVGIATEAEDRYQPKPSDLTPDLAGALVASPANPTGTMLGRAELAALIERAAELGIGFVSDEIYHGIQYAGWWCRRRTSGVSSG